MIHPYDQYSKNPYKADDVKWIKVKLYMCTLYKEKPIGPAFIEYHSDEVKSKRFEGIGIFTNGVLHMGPFLCRMGNGKRRLFSHMIDGRPAEKHFAT
jgi:hypothetical protein